MNFKFMQKIIDSLIKSPRGMTIINLVNATKLSRGTIKPLLDILCYTSQVEEVVYAQNVKVYYAKTHKVEKLLQRREK